MNSILHVTVSFLVYSNFFNDAADDVNVVGGFLYQNNETSEQRKNVFILQRLTFRVAEPESLNFTLDRLNRVICVEHSLMRVVNANIRHECTLSEI